ncbi:MAG: tRNA (adenosine(37)-N6)-threonylcarbamoyltransferase complex ATPase subunit type 1 TsaE [Chloroflexota bacterium]|nr:tRNA (adenosine(37)-N6)-threonylcarbamoyltransferase complex ATPase subunit type 1 TsaE [Chloroflexota bacterium]
MAGPGTSAGRSGAHGAASSVVRVRSASLAATHRLGQTLGKLLLAGDVILLEGALGAGKTALTQGIGVGLGVAGVINSPTFTILKEYAGRLPLYHFDLYRIDDPDEVYTLGFEDYFAGDGVCVVEWAERGVAPGVSVTPWPANYLRIHLRAENGANRDARLIEASGVGPRGLALLAAWKRAVAEES